MLVLVSVSLRSRSVEVVSIAVATAREKTVEGGGVRTGKRLQSVTAMLDDKPTIPHDKIVQHVHPTR